MSYPQENLPWAQMQLQNAAQYQQQIPGFMAPQQQPQLQANMLSQSASQQVPQNVFNNIFLGFFTPSGSRWQGVFRNRIVTFFGRYCCISCVLNLILFATQRRITLKNINFIVLFLTIQIIEASYSHSLFSHLCKINCRKHSHVF